LQSWWRAIICIPIAFNKRMLKQIEEQPVARPRDALKRCEEGLIDENTDLAKRRPTGEERRLIVAYGRPPR